MATEGIPGRAPRVGPGAAPAGAPPSTATLRRVAQIASTAAAALGGLALLGWSANLPVLFRFLAGSVSMKPNTALGLLALGTAQAHRAVHPQGRWRVGAALALAVTGIGAATLIEYAWGVSLGIDEWLFREETQAAFTSAPGRMAPTTALVFVCLGIAATAQTLERLPGLPFPLALASGLVAYGSMLEYGFGATPEPLVVRYTEMALPTTLAFLLLSVATIAVRPSGPFCRLALSDTMGGAMVRRLAPGAIVIPAVLAWLKLLGHRAGLFQTELGLALLAFGLTVVFMAFIWWNAMPMMQLDDARRDVERALARSTRALRALSGFNQQLIRAADDRALMATCCRMLVEDAGYRMAWVGLAGDDPARTVRPAAQVGFADGYLERERITWADDERGRGPTGTAIRTGRAVAARDILHDPAMGPWREAARARGYASSFALPVRVGGRVLGALTVYAAEPDAFDPDEERLLEELAADLGFGLETMQVRTERLLLASAVEQSADLLLITDTAGRIQYVNRAFERVTGFAREDAIGANPRILKSGVQDAAFYRSMWETLARGGEWRGRVVNRRKDGTRYVADCWTGPVHDASGRMTHYVSTQRDVTREVALEGQLVQAQKMEAIGRLAGGVAHDFNNLLTVINGYSETLLEAAGPDEPVHRPLAAIHQAGQRAADLTRQLLAFSRRQVIAPKVVDLNQVVTGIDRMLRRLIGEDVRLECELAADLGRVRIDPGQMDQILLNLAVNARDAMPRGGRLAIATANLEVGAADLAGCGAASPGTYVQLTVRDDGEGMTPETMAHLFEPFFTTKGVGRGTGLGLATVYGILEQNGGFIRVESVPGRGSTFHVCLPRVEAEPDSSAVAARLALSAGRETILVVEDEPMVRALTCETLRQRGYQVLEAEDGEAAMARSAAHAGRIDLLLTDAVMPGLGGRELAARLRRERPALKVLVVSGYDHQAPGLPGAADPEVAFLMKPVMPTRLAARVRDLLDGAAEA